LAQEKDEECSADEEAQEEDHQSTSNHDHHEHRKSTAKTPGEIDEPMRVRLTRKYVEAV
jgi:predicted DNA binding CopG/RHH family protein